MKSKGIYILLFLLSGFQPRDIAAQPTSTAKERGRRLGRRYLSSEINGRLQNFDILQDERGLVYIANAVGVIEYDGVSWRGIHRVPAHSLALGNGNRVYVGGFHELGYLATDTTGRLGFISLKTLVPDSLRDPYLR